MAMSAEHKAKMVKGVRAYHETRRAQSEQEQRDFDEWVFNEQRKIFAKVQRVNAMESRVRELESRLSKYEPLHA